MRIENLGLPGSGKSTLSNLCRKRLRSADVVATDAGSLDKIDKDHPPSNSRLWQDGKWRQNYHLARYLNDHPDMHRLFNALYGDNMRSLSLALGVGADVSRYQMNADRVHSFWVDEGFFHLGSHALLGGADWQFPECLSRIDAFLAAVPLPDVILHVHASVETATNGIFARLEGRSQEQADRRFNKTFGGTKGMEARAQLIDVLIERLEDQDVQIITVPAHTDLENLCETVLGQVS